MMRLGNTSTAMLAALLLACVTAQSGETVSLKTDSASFGIDDKGSLCAIVRAGGGRDYLAPGQPAPLLQVRIGGKFYAPAGAIWDAKAKRLIFVMRPQARAPERPQARAQCSLLKPSPRM